MKKTEPMNRRDFIKLNTSLVLGASGILSLLGNLNSLKASNEDGYKALVCIFLEGGNDSFNMLIPTSEVAYDDYAYIRGELSIPKEELLPLNGLNYGLYNMPNIQEMFNNSANVAIMANVGTLIKPIDKVDVLAQNALPPQLFSHIDQQYLWMSANAKDQEQSGWAAKAGNMLNSNNMHTNISIDGSNFMQMGGDQAALEINSNVVPYDEFGYFGYFENDAFTQYYKKDFTAAKNHDNLLVKAHATTLHENITIADGISSALQNATPFQFSSTFPHEGGVPLVKQMEFIAKMISIKDNLSPSPQRQIFFARIHGWDTHDNQNEANAGHPAKLAYLDSVIGEFQNAIESLGLQNQVTTFTASEFGRSLVPNNNGTDHGWGGHSLIIGGAVNGGQVYGEIPELKLEGEHYSSDFITDDGRVIPTTSVEQYMGTLAEWFGNYTEEEMAIIFPNLNEDFTTLNFMQT